MAYNRPVVRAGQSLALEARPGDSFLNPRVSVKSDTGAVTLTVSDILGGIVVNAGGTAAANYTTPTAAALLSSLDGMDIGDSQLFVLSSAVAFATTLVGGTGVTVVGNAAAAANASRTYVITRTGASTITIRGL